MTDYKLYPNLPLAPPENPQVAYHLSIIQAKMQGLKNKEQTFKQKNEKYNKILNQLMLLNACSSRISVATGISSVATFATFIGLPVSMALCAASMTGVIASGIISVLAKKYQKKLTKVTHLIDIITPALVVFERVISGALKNGVIDEEEFNTLQTLYSLGFTFIGIPVSAALGVASMTGAIASGIISVLTKMYQKKLKKVTKLIDIVTPPLVVFERVISSALKDGIIDEEEFNTLQTLHLETLNELTGVDHRMEAEDRSLVEKGLMEEINELKKKAETKA